MWRYLTARLALSGMVLFGVSLLTFVSLHLLPGDPVTAMMGRQLSSEAAESLREQLGLNDPLPVQYVNYVSKAVRGDFGVSLRTGRGVLDSILEQMPSTVQLAVAALGIAALLGFGFGMLAVAYRHTWVDSLVMTLSISGVSIPHFWLAILLMLVFSAALGWLPSVAPSSDPRGLVLPAVTLGLGEAAVITRLVRASLLSEMGQSYLMTARGKGLSERGILLRHALPNALIPVISIIALQFGFLLSGAVVVESIFARQGIGRLAVAAINNRDFPVIQGIVLFVALIYVGINTVTDILYVIVNPRIRLS